MKMKLFLILGLVLTTLAPGCSRKQGSQATPKDAVKKFAEGFMEFDKAKVMASVTGDKLELEALSVFMDYMIAVKDFKKAVTNQYGASGWAHFENEGGAKLSLNLTDNRDKLDSAKIEVNNDNATCTIPGEAQVLNLSRKNGLWYVDAGNALATDGADLKNFVRMWTGMTELIRKKQQRIGQPGVTAQSLDMELGKELLNVLTTNR